MEDAAHDIMLMNEWLSFGWPISAEIELILCIISIILITVGRVLPNMQLFVPSNGQEQSSLYFFLLRVTDAYQRSDF